MRGVYTAQTKIDAINSMRTLMYLRAPSDAVVEILSASVTNSSNETNEQLLCSLQYISSSGTPTVSGLTPSSHSQRDRVADASVWANVTANEPTYSANTQVGYEGFNTLGGWFFDPVPEERPVVKPSGMIGIRLLATPTAFDCVVRMTFREIS